MRAYGYDRDEWEASADRNETPPLRTLREADLTCNAEDLRRIHRFITDVLADATEKGWFELGSWHEHVRDRDSDWTDDESDLVIVFAP
jgi:hypothetical protein